MNKRHDELLALQHVFSGTKLVRKVTLAAQLGPSLKCPEIYLAHLHINTFVSAFGH